MSAGLVVAIVGFFSSFPIVLQGIKSIGANEVQAASGLMMASVAMGVAGIGLSLWKKMPISVAWSTPGVALLAVTLPIEDGFAGAVAGFIIAGGLTVLAGLWRPLGKLATSVPAPLAQAMLAGVLVSLCIAPFKAMAEVPMTAIPVVVTWFGDCGIDHHRICDRFFNTIAREEFRVAGIYNACLFAQRVFKHRPTAVYCDNGNTKHTRNCDLKSQWLHPARRAVIYRSWDGKRRLSAIWCTCNMSCCHHSGYVRE
jgi:hypothetical protein